MRLPVASLGPFGSFPRLARLLSRLLLTLAAAALVAGCAAGPGRGVADAPGDAGGSAAPEQAAPGTGDQGPSGSSGGTGADEATWPMTVTDDAGRTVTIPAEPRRILSLAPSNTEILFALGLGDRVVGVDNFSDYPPEAAALPRIGDLMNPNYEAMAALSPDLALAIGGSDEVWKKLEELGVPVLVIQPRTVAEVIDSIRLVGRITGAQEAAEALARSMAERVEAVQRQAAALSHRPRVFWEVWDDPLMSAGPGSFFDDMIRLAGGINVAGDAQSPWPQVSPEAIIARDPEVILTTQAEWAERLRSGALPAWAGTTAVRQGRIHVVEDNLVSRPGPRIVEGLEQVARAIQSQGAGR